MKSLLRQCGVLVLLFAVVYGLAIGVSYLVFPPLHTLDTRFDRDTIYFNQRRMAAFGVWEPALRGNDPSGNLILLGASDVNRGFRPAELEPLLRGYKVHNLSLNATGFPEIAQQVDAIECATVSAGRPRPIYLLGLWYGLFTTKSDPGKGASLAQRIGPIPVEFPIDCEAARWGLYRVREDHLEPTLPASAFSLSMKLLRPLLFAETVKMHCVEDAKGALLPFLRRLIWDRVIDVRLLEGQPPWPWGFEGVAPAKELGLWNRVFAPPPSFGSSGARSDQFEVLAELCDDIRQHGARLILVDMPMPAWHKQGSPTFPVYRARLAELLRDDERMSGIPYIDLTDAEVAFGDGMHAARAGTASWSRALAPQLSAVLGATPARPTAPVAESR